MSVVAAAIGGSAIAGVVGSAMSANAAGDAADSAAAAQNYATDRTIEEARKNKKEAIAASKERNRLAFRATKGGAGDKRDALLDANRDTAGHLTEGAKGSRKATVAGHLKNNAFFKDVFSKQAAALDPWRDAGRQAINTVSKGLKDGRFTMDTWKFKADPGYQFRLGQGQEALDRQAAAGGNLFSGGQLAAAQEYGQEFASHEYDRAHGREAADRQRMYDQNMGVADRGQRAVTETNLLRGDMAAKVGAGNLGIAEARANYADTVGKIGATRASNRGGILGDYFDTVAGADAQRHLNIANTTAGAITNAGATTTQALQNQGTNLANIYMNEGQMKQQAIGQGVQAVDSGLENLVTWQWMKDANLLGGAG
jgi:hypothetical protein